jgi:hydroxymethylglutaryl-CoA lyase
MPSIATIVEVGPRDGFQPIAAVIPTATKVDFVRRLYDAGIRRMEVTAFVSNRSVPQLADAADVLRAAQQLQGLAAQVLVPNARYCEKALAAGARDIAFVLSASEKHNINNVRRTPHESVGEYARIIEALPAGVPVRVNLATAFDCPFDGAVAADEVIALLDQLLCVRADVEVALCDTTGRATPDRVRNLFARAMSTFTDGPRWAFHGHDTYGLGVANVLAACAAGVQIFDSSIGGLGGCPFAPGATGNVATEDVIWSLEAMGTSTAIDIAALLPIALDASRISGASPGGRVRDALLSKSCLAEQAA